VGELYIATAGTTQSRLEKYANLFLVPDEKTEKQVFVFVLHSTIKDGYQTWYRNKQQIKDGGKKQNKE